jgi:hypothetical protein
MIHYLFTIKLHIFKLFYDIYLGITDYFVTFYHRIGKLVTELAFHSHGVMKLIVEMGMFLTGTKLNSSLLKWSSSPSCKLRRYVVQGSNLDTENLYLVSFRNTLSQNKIYRLMRHRYLTKYVILTKPKSGKLFTEVTLHML